MRRVLTAVCLFVLFTGPAWADTVIERYSRSGGFAGMGAFESTSVQTTSTTAQREESRMKFTGGFLSAIQKMAGFGDSIRITRLDRDLVWTLDPEKKTYTEAPLTVKGERERPGSVPPRKDREKEKGEPSDVVITKNEFKVEKTGASKVISGFPCEDTCDLARGGGNTKTGETGKAMTDRLWTTPQTAEIRAAQAEGGLCPGLPQKLGLEMSPAEAGSWPG
jgi:hypothetical protein